jgi:hypothetical protein
LVLSGYPDDMGKGSGPWQDGRRAWARLSGWHQDAPAEPAHPDDGDQALDALGDVGLVRRLLDQAELIAVRTARRHGKSWAEIATRLGVTRQSAWERWRDLDEAPVPEPAAELPTRPAEGRPAAGGAGEDLGRTARAMRRRSSVRVPNVVGLKWDDARSVLLRVRLIGIGAEPDGIPTQPEGGVVTDQSPESGAKVPAGSQVRLWIGRGGSGVREPRRPRPVPRAGREMRTEPSDEAVG